MEQERSNQSFEQVSERNPGIQNGKPVSIILFLLLFKQQINVGKNIRNIQKKSPKAISSRYRNLFFLLYFVLGLFIIFMKKFPLDMQ
jgi:hypothetical protein